MQDSFQMILMSGPKYVRDVTVAVPLHTCGQLDQENFYRRKKEWHTVDTVVTA